MRMLSTAALLLIFTCDVAVGQDHRQTVEGQILPVDMALDSVDDQYKGCTQNMANLVKTEYLNREISKSSDFREVWQEGEREHHKPEDGLTTNHSVAIFVYTSPRVYSTFNQDVIRGKHKYINLTYTWYSLHFLLTEAVQILKKTQRKCKLTYRGTRLQFDTNVLNKEVRFGVFASSSTDRGVAKSFGTVSCFEINTCEGADVSKFSVFSYEKEVLIPPYEKFIVSAVKSRSQDAAWCDTVFVLRSSGIRSDLNCVVASVQSQIHHRCHSLWLTGLFIFIQFSSVY